MPKIWITPTYDQLPSPLKFKFLSTPPPPPPPAPHPPSSENVQKILV